MAAGPTIVARFIADTRQLLGSLDDVERQGKSKLGSFASGAALAIGGAFAAAGIADFAKDSIDAASDLQESVSKVGQVFKTSGDEILAWSQNAAESMGLSQNAALQAVGTFGNLAVSLGLPQDQATDMSKSLVDLASDLGSFNNVPVDQALNALKSGLVGETEPLRTFGVNINDAALKAEALSLGLVKSSVDMGALSAAQETSEKASRKAAEALKTHGENSVEFKDAARDAEQANTKLAEVMEGKVPDSLTAAEKAQASYSLIMKQTGLAQGDFERTSEGLANSTKSAGAKFDDLKAKVGTALLPAMQGFVSFLSDSVLPALESLGTFLTTKVLPAFESISSWIADNKEVVTAALIGFGAVVLAIVVPAFIAWAIAAGTAAAATLVALGPIILGFALIGAAVAAVAFVVIKNWDTIVSATQTAWNAVISAVQFVWNWIKDNWPLLLAIITGPIGIAVLLIQRNWDTIKDGATAVWRWVVDKWNAIQDGISSAVDAVGRVIGLLVDVFFRRPIDAATEMFNWVTGKFRDLADFIFGIVDRIADAAGRIADAIKTPINAIIGLWNNLEFRVPTFSIPEVDTHIPGIGKIGGGSFGGQTFDFPNLPFLADGGVLTNPTLFVGGEAGTEIVAPEDLLRAIVAEESGGGSYTLNIYPRTADAADIAYGFRRLELMAGLP
jgi:hypothetical protein